MTIDRQSLTWRQVEAWTRAEIQHARDRLERRNLDERSSDFDRGRIAALRDLLAMAEPDAGPAVAPIPEPDL